MKKILYDIGAKDVVLLVEALHKRGYERLRFSGNMSPSGGAYRVQLLRKEDMDWTGYLEDYPNKEIPEQMAWHGAVGFDSCGKSAEELADLFAACYPELLSASKGKDPEYAFWFRKVVWLAHRSVFQIGYADYLNCYEKGCLPCVGMNEKDWVLPMPPTGEHRHLEPYYRFYKGESANPHAPHTVRHNIYASSG